jgi:hypothetical protein
MFCPVAVQAIVCVPRVKSSVVFAWGLTQVGSGRHNAFSKVRSSLDQIALTLGSPPKVSITHYYCFSRSPLLLLNAPVATSLYFD